MKGRLVIVLGDQLSPGLSSLVAADKSRDVVVMAEVWRETQYANHHKKKLIFVLSAMRHFAEELRKEGWTVHYVRLDQATPCESLTAAVDAAVRRHKPEGLIATAAGEHRVQSEMESWGPHFNLPLEIHEDDRFVCSRKTFENWAEGRKTLRMEYFYREMRKATGFLMDGANPAEGKWNFDAENRKAAPQDLKTPAPPRFEPDRTTQEVIDLVEKKFASNFGEATPFWFAVTRADAERARDHFIERALPGFGDYQDAMVADNRFLNHAVLSAYLNAGLLDPLDLCARAEAAYRAGRAPINAVEGFIRQIIGWREYVRGLYWREGPDYPNRNYFNAKRALPGFYWTGETDMACVAAAVDQTREEAYAHHIQRLMVTGNFALIAGINPYEVHEWYLGVYADAYEWVEAPNVIGMSQFADGGVLASKPYASGGAYIKRMSDYCKDCRYSPGKKTEDDACPFNALYWDFLLRNEKKLKPNARLSRVYQNWARMDDQVKSAYRARARRILKKLDEGERI